MIARDVLRFQLARLQGHWRHMPATPQVLADYEEQLEGYDDEELVAGVSAIIRDHRGMASPTPAAVIDAVAAVAKIRRRSAVTAATSNPLAYCPLCGTTQLVESPVWPNGQRRMVPRHAWMGERPCPRAGAESETAAPVNMAAWPSDRPTRGAAPERGLAGIGAVLEEVVTP
jgi:hypothetical protein